MDILNNGNEENRPIITDTTCVQSDEKNQNGRSTEKFQYFEVCESDQLGRHIKATQDIEEGQIVINEEPLITGPSQVTGPVCLACLNAITAENSVGCDKCGWPLCKTDQCHANSSHQAECDWTVHKRQQKVKIQQFVTPHRTYECVTAIRCLYQKEHNFRIWKKLMSLECHSEEREGTEKYEMDCMFVAQFLHRFFKIDENEFSEADILKICGIIQVNGHESPLTDPPHVSIYKTASLLEHSCFPNCCKSFSSDGNLLVRATKKIFKGENITICYTDPLWSTINRREHLAITKYFYCECERCNDPTEMGTFYSGLKCSNKECNGYVVPYMTAKNNHLPNVIWTCTTCHETKPSNEIGQILSNIAHDFALTNKEDPKSCKLFLDHYTNNNLSLHANHYFLTDMRLKLAQLYGQSAENDIQGLSDDDLNHKVELCHRVLAISKILFPAEWRIRGVLMFELHASVAEEARRNTANKKIDSQMLHLKLMESKRWLEDAAIMLKYEPEILPEGKMAKQAEQNLADLNDLLRKIHLQIGDTIL